MISDKLCIYAGLWMSDELISEKKFEAAYDTLLLVAQRPLAAAEVEKMFELLCKIHTHEPPPATLLPNAELCGEEATRMANGEYEDE